MPRPGTRRAFIATTTISVLRVPAGTDEINNPRDGDDPLPDPEQIDSLVVASIGMGRATENRDGTSRTVGVTRLICDPTDLLHTDLIIDETTGITWALTSSVTDYRLDLNYMAADLQRVSGVA